MRAFEFLGGVPEIVTPDNLKSGVTKACRYEPGVNRTYEEMAAHYGGAVVPVTAMLDRILHHGHVLKCGPRSWRTKAAVAAAGGAQ